MAHELLHLLDEIVASDGGPAGFCGTICVGVGHQENLSWWRGQFGTRVEHGLVAEVDPEADAIFALGEQAATDIVRSGVGNAEPSYVIGDTALLARFLQRYFQSRSPLSIRAGGTP